MSGRIFFGFILVILGIAFLFDELQIIQFGELLSIYWPLIIIVIGLYNLIKKNNKPMSGFIFILIGVFLQLKKLNILPYDIWDYFWPVLFIVTGLAIIFPRNSKSKIPAYSEDKIDYFVVFSGLTTRNNSRHFRGGNIYALFGGADIDLTDAEIAGNDAYLDLVTAFGGINIKVPEHWKVIVKGLPLFGGWENKTKLKNMDGEKDIPVLKVHCFALFGGIEVKN